MSDAVVRVTLDGPAARVKALELAAKARGVGWTDAHTVETAEAYLAFLMPEDSTT